jgi:hypothetical protein
VARFLLYELVYEVSCDPHWRQRLFRSQVGEVIAFTHDELSAIDARIRAHADVYALRACMRRSISNRQVVRAYFESSPDRSWSRLLL